MPAPGGTNSRRKALRVQADVPHTFGTLLIPLSVILVLCGIFLVERSIAHPLESDAGAILFGSVVLACGLLLLGFLLRSIHIFAASMPRKNRSVEQSVIRLTSPRVAAPAKAPPPPPRPFHRFYVDDARISR